jgi:hypothetical protein
MSRYKFLQEVTTPVPGQDEVHIELWLDTLTNGVFAVDSSFLESQSGDFYNPFTGDPDTLVDPDVALKEAG